ncbi:hypothetical protein EJ03DRAFT_380652 [Teratosphaeria nubilosa]|uniref:AD domain-containing protein n=1 Tax=Teratosphaeria nubilosa TaxID=161662 RepID=A0A6G1LKE0_9PEZI|nr:hypothetical protein EJ03DRAFT_380652 [Teratosphaeria nubilosa]
MADGSKRNSVAGKVAPSKAGGAATTASQSVPDGVAALAKSVGASIKITTAAPHIQTYEGTLYAADPITNIVAINTSGSTDPVKPANFHLLPFSRIKDFTVVSVARNVESGEVGFASALPPIGKVDVEQVRKREEDAIKKLKEAEKHKGKGVSSDGQEIYDSFRRLNMEVRWHNAEIIVYNSVIITPPYRVEDCKGPKDKQETLLRVKKVLEGERKQMSERKAPVAPRKGG